MINSGSTHREGLATMARQLTQTFHPLGGTAELIEAAPLQIVTSGGATQHQTAGQILRIRKRPAADRQVLLVGHMDTVFPADDLFQTCTDLGDGRLQGPGVADMKGGLLVMFAALRAFEASPVADRIGWEVLINGDEETGSFGSAHLIAESATRAHVGLGFEPSLPDGTLVGARKGSGNFTLVVRGRSAHAGREPHLGRNAITAAARLTLELDALNGGRPGLTVNMGKVEGGGALNVVPDLAILRLNVRMQEPADQNWFQARLDHLVTNANRQDGIQVTLHGRFSRPPKAMTPGLRQLLDLVQDCGRDLGLSLSDQPTGGCCDGNNMAATGLPTVDTLGVRGAHIHSAEEYMIKDSLTERAKLTALILLKLASGASPFPERERPS